MKYGAAPTLLGLAVLLAASLVSGWTTRALSPDPLPRTWRPGGVVAARADAEGLPVVTTGEVRAMVEEGTRLLLDARALTEYDAGHIPTAMPLPVNDFEASFPGIAPMLTADTPLVTYCGGPDCDDALRLALRLREAGYPEVALYLEGMEGWEGEKTPRDGAEAAQGGSRGGGR